MIKSEEIVIVVAHPSEAVAAGRALTVSGCECSILTTGVGGMAMSWSLQKRFHEGEKPSLIINAGIAGSYVDNLSVGDVVMPVSDCFGDMGVDDNGDFVSLFRMNLASPDSFPFTDGRIVCSNRWTEALGSRYLPVSAATVNMASGSSAVIERIRKAWQPDIETMEGAWFAYTCAMKRIDYFSLRAISNLVEPRNLKKWNIPLALEMLEKELAKTLNILNTI